MQLARNISSDNPTKAAATLLLLACLSLLVGCQGFSAASSSSSQQQTGNLSFGASSLNFGSVTLGSSKTLTVTAANSEAQPVTINSVALSTKYFSLTAPSLPVVIAAGQSVSLSVKFTPNAAGPFTGTVSVSSDASNTTSNLSLAGTGVAAGQMTLNPSSQDFGSVTLGSTQAQSVTLTNTGGSSVNISQASVSGAGFQLSGISTPLTLNGAQSTTFTVAFSPQSAGNASGTVTITSDASNSTLTMALSGTGTSTVGQLAVSPGTLGLGNVVVGTSGSASGSLTASGASVTVSNATTNNSAFSVGGLALPLTIPAGQSASFTVTFSPQVKGAASASLTLTSNAQPSTIIETLTGTGTPAPTHLVNLSWNASTSSNVVGYNIYRAVYGTSSCGGYSKINPVLNTTTVYTDSTVADGASYCYGATAVNSSNEESSYSNIVSNLQIPAQ